MDRRTTAKVIITILHVFQIAKQLFCFKNYFSILIIVFFWFYFSIPTQETLLQSVLNSIRVSDDEAEEGEIMNYESLTVDVKVEEENEAMNSKEDTTLGKNKKEFDEIVDCGGRVLKKHCLV